MKKTEQQALDILARIARCESSGLAPDQDLVGDLGIDSPKALQLLCELEDECGIEVPDDAVGQMDTVGDMLRMIRTCEAQVTTA